MVEPCPSAATPAAEACMCRVVDLVNLVLESTAVSGLMFLFILIILTILTSLMFMPSLAG